MEKLDEILFRTADFIKKGDNENAEKAIQDGLKVYPDSAILYTNLGMLKLMKKEIDTAIDLLEKAIKLDSRILEAYQNIGSCYLYKMEIEKSETAFLKALQIDPNNFNTYHNISTLYIQTDQLPKAKKSLEKLIQIDSSNIQVSFMLGMVSLSLKEYYPAIANLLYVLIEDPENINARAGVAESYYRMGRYKMSLKEYDKIIKIKPDLLSPYIKSALVLIELGLNPEAIPYLSKALEIDRTNLEALEILAILYEEKADFEKAEELYQEILILDPHHKSAEEAVKRLENFLNTKS